jgi:AcrR family transcriptional regulator
MSTELVARVEEACDELAGAGRAVTISAVARQAGIGRATFYRRPELRALVAERRLRGREALTLTGLATRLEQLHGSVDAIADRVRRHDELLRRLTAKGQAGRSTSRRRSAG